MPVIPGLIRYANRMVGNQADAEDAVQEALMIAWRRLDQFEGSSSLQTWLYRIVQNCLIDHWRRQQRRAKPLDPTSEEFEAIPVDYTDRGQPLDEATSARVDIQRALRTLQPDLLEALLLVEVEGFTFHEAAQVAGVDARTISARRARAFKDLRTFIHTPNATMETPNDSPTGTSSSRSTLATPWDLSTIVAGTNEQTHRVTKILEQLSPEDAEMLRAWFIDANSSYGTFPDVAAGLGLDLPEARARLRNAKRRFGRLWKLSEEEG